MRQILQSLRTGAIEVADVPSPTAMPGHVVIRTSRTLISPGTERTLLEFGRGSWIEKARRQPDKMRRVFEKIHTDGLLPTLEAVRNKLDQPLALGYCNVGVVQEVGEGVDEFAPGDRVASNGKHAELVSVPQTLCVKVPDTVNDDDAAFTVIGAIALEGLRLAQPLLGEVVVVMGLGLVGQLTVQLLHAQGCRVLATDMDPQRLELARRFGAATVDLATGEDPISAAEHFSRGRGVDVVLITATTVSSEPVHQAARMCRKRGRIVLVGVTGLELSRTDFYEKELTFQVSCSYGPGRYDPLYEDKGRDYPVGYVRWTAQRNFEAVLDLFADGRIDVRRLVSHRFAIAEAEKAYDLLASGEPSLGILLDYGDKTSVHQVTTVALRRSVDSRPSKFVLSVVGAGTFATGVLIPAFQAAGARLRKVVSQGGVSALQAGRKFSFEEVTTELDGVLGDSETSVVAIATRHDSHARLIIAALRAGKHVYVEKPLCLTLAELDQIEALARQAGRELMIGFNRRFAPHIDRMRSVLAAERRPKALVVTVNAGSLPAHHWTEDPEVGGGRILGEACHFIDLLRHLVSAPITHWTRFNLEGNGRNTANIELVFADGSVGTIHYLENGCRRFPKERVEVFAGGKVLQLENFRMLRGYGCPGFSRMRLWRQDKGHKACVAAFVHAIEQGKPAPIPLEEIFEVSRVTLELAHPGTGRKGRA